jgi:hypothetical protein
MFRSSGVLLLMGVGYGNFGEAKTLKAVNTLTEIC